MTGLLSIFPPGNRTISSIFWGDLLTYTENLDPPPPREAKVKCSAENLENPAKMVP